MKKFVKATLLLFCLSLAMPKPVRIWDNKGLQVQPRKAKGFMPVVHLLKQEPTLM